VLESARPSGPPWLASLRRAAKDTLSAGGFPTKKHEAWRFTSVREIVDTAFGVASGDAAQALALVDRTLGDDGTHRFVIVDGRPIVPEASWDGTARARSLARVLANDASMLESWLGRVARAEHFAALNAALFEDGVLLEIAGEVDRPIHLVHVGVGGAAPAAAYPRIVVSCEGSAKLIETYLTAPGAAKHLTNAVTEVVLADGAKLDHTRIVLGDERALHLAYLAVKQGASTTYASHVVTLGGALSRVELDVHLSGEGASAELDGVYVVDRQEHVDHQIFVEHAVGQGTSHTRYRGILDGRGHAVFNAMGIVRKDAQRTQAHQENKNLLLSDDATIDTKPHLEIEADDVKASHGATIGSVDEEALFYLRARGISEDEARDVLTYAFVRELLEKIPHEPTSRFASDAVLARLRSGARIKELS
jgi:Fe-S cluster assembly protein SufD